VKKRYYKATGITGNHLEEQCLPSKDNCIFVFYPKFSF
jgi:hypothetical protein